MSHGDKVSSQIRLRSPEKKRKVMELKVENKGM
jgi:hypothetical protein